MSDRTKIEWAEASWNPLRARRIDLEGRDVTDLPGLWSEFDHCYAADSRAKVEPFIDEKTLLQPLKWRKPRRIFVCSMTDLFGAWHTDQMIDRVFAVMARCPQHTFLVLTKRPERMTVWFSTSGHKNLDNTECTRSESINLNGLVDVEISKWPLPNVWLGVTAGNQQQADERIPLLLHTPATKHFVSVEPMLGPVDLHPYLPRLNWIIAGGESGHKARPSHPDWFRSLRDQCQAAGVQYFFKQWGEWAPRSHGVDFDKKYQWGTHTGTGFCHSVTPWNGHDDDGSTGEAVMIRVGKKAAGRKLDGREWNEVPG